MQVTTIYAKWITFSSPVIVLEYSWFTLAPGLSLTMLKDHAYEIAYQGMWTSAQIEIGRRLPL